MTAKARLSVTFGYAKAQLGMANKAKRNMISAAISNLCFIGGSPSLGGEPKLPGCLDFQNTHNVLWQSSHRLTLLASLSFSLRDRVSDALDGQTVEC